jgi:hypothetical protein
MGLGYEKMRNSAHLSGGKCFEAGIAKGVSSLVLTSTRREKNGHILSFCIKGP